jgi:AcrR family transcriptional regulator
VEAISSEFFILDNFYRKRMIKNMGIQDRKRREWEARHEAIIAATRRIIISEGYPNLTMDRLGEAIEYSRGTIYQHFKNKQEVTGAVLVQAEERFKGLMLKGLNYRHESTRVRALAPGVAYEIFFTLHPEDFGVLEVVNIKHLQEDLPARVGEGMDDLGKTVLEAVLNNLDEAETRGNSFTRRDTPGKC